MSTISSGPHIQTQTDTDLLRLSSGFPTNNTSAPVLPVVETINATATTNTTDISASVLPELITGPILSDVIHGDFWLSEPPKDHRRLTPSERRSLDKRGDPPLPPRDRTLADHMENYGQDLPECYKKCMRSEDGKSSIHMGKVCQRKEKRPFTMTRANTLAQDTLGKICGIKWPMFAWWSEHHIYWCVNGKNGCQDKQLHRDAYRWLKWTCGDKPS